MSPQPSFNTLFQFEQRAAFVTKIGMRRKGKGTKSKENENVAIDLKIDVAALPNTCLAALMAAPLSDVRDAFWRIEDEASGKVNPELGERVETRFAGLTKFRANAKYKTRHTLKIGDIPAVRVDIVDQFEVSPVEGEMIDCTFRVSVSGVPAGWIDRATSALSDSVLVTLEQDAELPLDGDPSEPEPKHGKVKTTDAQGRPIRGKGKGAGNAAADASGSLELPQAASDEASNVTPIRARSDAPGDELQQAVQNLADGVG